ncbi:MAG: glutamyl-tRNA reductase [Acidobacteriota bacterium]
MQVQLLGINHHTAPIELREALAMDGAGVRGMLRDIRTNPATGEAAILATCNRTELYVCTDEPLAAEMAMRRLFLTVAGERADLVTPHAYMRTGEEACRHLLGVAAGLDSMILGEHQILGQVREAQSRARDAETLGPLMNRLWSAALHTGKRARTETDIGMGAVSVASAAVSLAEQALGDLRNRRVLLIGAGDTCRLAARHFADRRPACLVVANRSSDRAAAVAAAFGGEAIRLDQIPDALGSTDVVVSATRAPGFVVTRDMVHSAVADRPERPLVLVDVAVPRDIEPSVETVPGVLLYPIDAVRTLVDRSLAHRLREVPRVEAIIDEECRKLMAWTRGLGASSVVRELAARFEQVRAEEVRRNLRHFHPEEEAAVERMTKALISRLLRAPITHLTSGEFTASVESARLEVVRELFALEPHSSRTEAGVGAP